MSFNSCGTEVKPTVQFPEEYEPQSIIDMQIGNTRQIGSIFNQFTSEHEQQKNIKKIGTIIIHSIKKKFKT
jgi:hypothetical protein